MEIMNKTIGFLKMKYLNWYFGRSNWFFFFLLEKYFELMISIIAHW